MNTQTCALFAQVIPVLYIAIFVGGQRITREMGRAKNAIGRVVRVYILLVMVAGAIAECLAIHGAAIVTGTTVGIGLFIYYTGFALASLLAVPALAGISVNGKPESNSDDKEGESGKK